VTELPRSRASESAEVACAPIWNRRHRCWRCSRRSGTVGNSPELQFSFNIKTIYCDWLGYKVHYSSYHDSCSHIYISYNTVYMSLYCIGCGLSTSIKDFNNKNRNNFKKIVMPPTCVWFCCLFNGIRFHFHHCACRSPYVALSVSALIGQVTLTWPLTFWPLNRFTDYPYDVQDLTIPQMLLGPSESGPPMS